uniref:Receptor-like kinase n=1 Tax=Nitella axillaris TaxID=3151 RepID=A7VM65_9VIRI|nr:receptor-like kinase [Nitella axillaris]
MQRDRTPGRLGARKDVAMGGISGGGERRQEEEAGAIESMHGNRLEGIGRDRRCRKSRIGRGMLLAVQIGASLISFTIAQAPAPRSSGIVTSGSTNGSGSSDVRTGSGAGAASASGRDGGGGGSDGNVGMIAAVIVGTIIGAGFLLLVLLVVFLCVRRGGGSGRSRKKRDTVKGSRSRLLHTMDPIHMNMHMSKFRDPPPWKVYSFDELTEATINFNELNKLGEGGFGSVYKGVLKDGHQIAVKRLKQFSHQGDREFCVEVETISRVTHKHLATMSGCCTERGERIIVYDFAPNKSLMAHLYGPYSVNNSLSWARRMRIAIGAAEGLRYLHEETQPKIIHRDIKASNILLDADYEALVSDFGLAKLVPAGVTHVTTRVKGTLGYLAPEYARLGQVSEKSDVYSFGVLLLELISGRKPIMRGPQGGSRITLVEWVAPLLEKRRLTDLLDRRLGGTFKEDELFRVVTVASLCVQQHPHSRPAMKVVLSRLIGAPTDVPKPIKKPEGEREQVVVMSDGPLPIAKVDYGSAIYEEDVESGGDGAQANGSSSGPGSAAVVNRVVSSPEAASTQVGSSSPMKRSPSPSRAVKRTPSPGRVVKSTQSIGTATNAAPSIGSLPLSITTKSVDSDNGHVQLLSAHSAVMQDN